MRTLRAPHNLKPITTLPAFAKATDGHSANVVMLTIPPRSDQSRSVCPHPIAIPFYFCLTGGILFFGMGDGERAGFFKEEAAQKKIQTKYKIQFQYRAFVHHIIVSVLKGIHPRHPPREFPLGLRAPVLGSRTFSNGSNTSK